MSGFEPWSLPDGFDGGRPTPDAIRSLLDRLASLSRTRREPRLGSVIRDRIQAIDRVGGRLLDAHDPLRRRALELLPGTSGLSPEMSEAVLDGMAADWRRDRLERLIERDLGPAALLDPFGTRVPGAPDRARRDGPAGGRLRLVARSPQLHVGSGSVPGVSATTLVRGILVGAGVLVKPGRGDTVLPVLVHRALLREAPEVAASSAVWYWDAPELTTGAVGRCGLVVVYGGDDAVRTVRGAAASTTRVVVYPHRVSVGLIGRDVLTEDRAGVLAVEAARAVAAFDQRGCVSPHTLFVEEGGAVSVTEWCQRLARALEAESKLRPEGRPTPDEAARRHQVLGAAELEAAAGPGVSVFRAGGGAVILEDATGFEGSCLGRVVRVRPVRDLDEAVAALASVGSSLQSVALEARLPRRLRLADALAEIGALRITSLGALPWPPAWWNHDGMGSLDTLVDRVDLEPAAGGAPPGTPGT